MHIKIFLSILVCDRCVWLKQVGSFTMAQMGQSKSVVGEFMKQKRKVSLESISFGISVVVPTLPVEMNLFIFPVSCFLLHFSAEGDDFVLT